ncbi:30S ribosome-binding factor RbfA [Candidatus Dependentiae bacterium]|nr:30S ribosome-binding factor RbfA [Candidatus Dependentiae bacterium]
MNKNPHRIERLQHLFQTEISRIIERDLKDPRVKMLSITRVIISRDLSLARVYFSTFQESTAEKCLEGFNSGSGFIHRLLLKRLILKHIPELKFYIDTSIKYARYMEDKLKKIVEGSEND